MSLPISKESLASARAACVDVLYLYVADATAPEIRDAIEKHLGGGHYSIREIQCALLAMLNDNILTRRREGRFYRYGMRE